MAEATKTQKEIDVENECMEYVSTELKGMFPKFVCPGRRGAPDRILIAPDLPVAFFEFKHPEGGRHAALQKWWRDEIKRRRHHYFKIKSLREFERALDYLYTFS